MKRISMVAIAAVVMILILSSFRSHPRTEKQPLVVERQQCILQFMVGDIPSEDFHIGITMDVPVDGDPVLVDSVVRLLNQALYYFMDNREERYFTPRRCIVTMENNYSNITTKPTNPSLPTPVTKEQDSIAIPVFSIT